MRGLSILCVSLFIFLLSACTAPGAPKERSWKPIVGWTGAFNQHRLSRGESWAIDKNAMFYVALSGDTEIDSDINSGLTTVVRKYYPQTRSGVRQEDLRQSLVSAQFSGVDFVVYPVLGDMVNPASVGEFLREEISIKDIKRGAVSVNIYIYAVNGEKLIDHLTLDTRSGLFSSKHLELLWPPLDAYLRKVSQFDG